MLYSKIMIKVFSGIRPSGKLHLGNYLGAIKNWLELQNSVSQAIFAVVDYHGITTPYNLKTYQRQIMDVVLDYLAAGIDPSKALLIRQSKIPQHTELAWLFNTIASVGWLDRLPTYLEQLEKTKINNMGLLDYPVLMAADILIYKSNLVPVGKDQLSHIDVTNEIAKRFNSMFPGRTGGETFEPVKPHLAAGAHIMSLQDPTKKMSKTPSADSGQAGDGSCLFLADTPDEIRAKIQKATTDSGKEINADYENKPGITNLMEIYALLSPKINNLKQIEEKYEGGSYVEFKSDLAEVVVNFLKPFQEKRREFEENPKMVLDILEKSEEKARELANKTLTEVKEKMGLL